MDVTRRQQIGNEGTKIMVYIGIWSGKHIHTRNEKNRNNCITWENTKQSFLGFQADLVISEAE